MMSKAFVKESETEDFEEEQGVMLSYLPLDVKNYITKNGYDRLKDELLTLIDKERPQVVNMVSWAASNGDRSENADYIYGKRRLREIDRRIHFLTKRLERAEIVENNERQGLDQVFFGATVSYLTADQQKHTVTIVGVDEINLDENKVSWISPIAHALLKASCGDTVLLKTPSGTEKIEIVNIDYN